jgi:hypothetical protein
MIMVENRLSLVVSLGRKEPNLSEGEFKNTDYPAPSTKLPSNMLGYLSFSSFQQDEEAQVICGSMW